MINEDAKLNARKALESILDAKEMSEIEMFLERPAMIEAVRKVLFWPITNRGIIEPGVPSVPDRNFLLNLVSSQYAEQGMVSDESLGAELRAIWKAVNMLEGAFQQIESFRKVVVQPKEVKNTGR